MSSIKRRKVAEKEEAPEKGSGGLKTDRDQKLTQRPFVLAGSGRVRAYQGCPFYVPAVSVCVR